MCAPGFYRRPSARLSKRQARYRRRESALKNLAGFVEAKTGGARTHAADLAIAQIAQEIGLYLGVGEEFLVHAFIAETGHGAAIQTQGAGGDDEITALKACAAPCHVPGFFRILGQHGAE